MKVDPSKRWIVRRSIESEDGLRCVDFFERADGTFGFQEFRRDFEDNSGWSRVGPPAAERFTSQNDCTCAARRSIAWLNAVMSC